MSALLMRGSQCCFCSSLPMRMIVGATDVAVSGSIGAPAVSISSMKIHCSTAVFSRPPYSFGHDSPHQPRSRSASRNLRARGPRPSLPTSRVSRDSDSSTCSAMKARTSSRHALSRGERS
jgi:hypothetical protein